LKDGDSNESRSRHVGGFDGRPFVGSAAASNSTLGERYCFTPWPKESEQFRRILLDEGRNEASIFCSVDRPRQPSMERFNRAGIPASREDNPLPGLLVMIATLSSEYPALRKKPENSRLATSSSADEVID
jgi:hypothetical protein